EAGITALQNARQEIDNALPRRLRPEQDRIVGLLALLVAGLVATDLEVDEALDLRRMIIQHPDLGRTPRRKNRAEEVDDVADLERRQQAAGGIDHDLADALVGL